LMMLSLISPKLSDMRDNIT